LVLKVTVIGSGYVGLVTGACLAEFGNDVFFLDVDARKIDILMRGEVPIHEPGLKPLLDRNRADDRIRFSTDIDAAVAHGDVIFIAVGTPPDEDGSADLRHVLAAARDIGRRLREFKVVVNKSTVPVGTAARVRARILTELRERDMDGAGEELFAVVSNPEFLKEGSAIEDFMRPDRIVLGTDEDAAGMRARGMMKALYAPIMRSHERLLCMDLRSAEFTKYAANAMLATRISFMNELAGLADRVGADIELVRQGMGADPRIGLRFLYAGVGYGGSCFPKDVAALLQTARETGQPLHILDAVQQVNASQKQVLPARIAQEFGNDLSGKVFAVWGLAFKPDTDDMREAPSIVIIAELLRRGAAVHAFDPVAMDEAARVLKQAIGPENFCNITFYGDCMQALQRCDALVIVTEWKIFRSPDFARMHTLMRQPLIFDGRNMYDPRRMKELGFHYRTIGRNGVAA
jgi:UDPglucose 6-dehydrogenase